MLPCRSLSANWLATPIAVVAATCQGTSPGSGRRISLVKPQVERFLAGPAPREARARFQLGLVEWVIPALSRRLSDRSLPQWASARHRRHRHRRHRRAFARKLRGLREIACGIDRARQALDANQLEQTREASAKTAILVQVDGLAKRYAPLHRFKFTFHRAAAANNRDLRFAQKLGPAQIAAMCVNNIGPAPCPRRATIAFNKRPAPTGYLRASTKLAAHLHNSHYRYPLLKQQCSLLNPAATFLISLRGATCFAR